MYCCATIRPASMVAGRLTQPPWTCLQTKLSEDRRVLPRVASPFICPRWLFRCFTLFGIIAIVLSSSHVVKTLIDPHLNTNVSLRPSSTPRNRNRFLHARCSAEWILRSASLATRHLRTTKATSELDLDAPGTGFHRSTPSHASWCGGNAARFASCSAMSSATN